MLTWSLSKVSMWLNLSPLLTRSADSLKFLRAVSRLTCRAANMDSFVTFRPWPFGAIVTFLPDFFRPSSVAWPPMFCRMLSQFIKLNSSVYTLNIQNNKIAKKGIYPYHYLPLNVLHPYHHDVLLQYLLYFGRLVCRSEYVSTHCNPPSSEW